MLSFFPRGVLDEILNLIESVSEGFPSYSLNYRRIQILRQDGRTIGQTDIRMEGKPKVPSGETPVYRGLNNILAQD